MTGILMVYAYFLKKSQRVTWHATDWYGHNRDLQCGHKRPRCDGFPLVWSVAFVRGNHRSPVDPHHKGQWCGALMLSLICAWTNGWANNRDVGNLRRHHAHYDVSLMYLALSMEASYKTYQLWYLMKWRPKGTLSLVYLGITRHFH